MQAAKKGVAAGTPDTPEADAPKSKMVCMPRKIMTVIIETMGNDFSFYSRNRMHVYIFMYLYAYMRVYR